MFKLLKSSEKTNRSARAADAVHTLALHSITTSTAPSTTEEEERAMVLLFQIELMGVDVACCCQQTIFHSTLLPLLVPCAHAKC